LSSAEFEVPNELSPGWVIEWISKPTGGEKGFIKFYRENGETFKCDEIQNGHPRNVFDFVALAQNMASEKGLSVSCSETAKEQVSCGSNAPFRCLVIGC
jgi:hypothetical protein